MDDLYFSETVVNDFEFWIHLKPHSDQPLFLCFVVSPLNHSLVETRPEKVSVMINVKSLSFTAANFLVLNTAANKYSLPVLSFFTYSSYFGQVCSVFQPFILPPHSVSCNSSWMT